VTTSRRSLLLAWKKVDYYAPAFRFDDEGDNPWIPWRDASFTPLPDNDMVDARLAQEKRTCYFSNRLYS
jgi:hypothetical protein